MTFRYIDAPLADLDTPEPTRTPRTLAPRYIEPGSETPAPRPQIPDTAYGLPAYWSTLPPRPVLPPPDPRPVLPTPGPPPALPTVSDMDLAQLREAFTQYWEALRPGLTKLGEDLQRIFVQLVPPTRPVAAGPDDPHAHALWQRQHRNTGPSRDLTHQRRPRQHPGGPR